MRPVPGGSRREVVLASANPGKIREIRAILGALPWSIRSLAEFPGVVLPEEGGDYQENAVAKAEAVARATGRPALADDSGLEVDALAGAPGPYSARYGGPGLDDAGRVAHLLASLEGTPPERRGARFVCVAAWAEAGDGVVTARGECRGRILDRPHGHGGFGYDPVFQPSGESCSMAELPAQRKNAISHRAHAFRALAGRVTSSGGRSGT